MLKGVLAIASIGLTIFALADCIQCENAQLRGLPKWAWIVLIVLLPWVGPLTWLLAGKDRESGTAGPFGPRGWQPGQGGAGSSPRPRPLAPDEDPDFLRKLDEDIRRERRERGEHGDDSTS